MSATAPASAAVLVVGWSQVGKTVLATQLLLRLRSGRGRLRLRMPPPDVSLLESAKEDLSEGLAPKHTPEKVLGNLTFNLEGPVDLVWPDYGGEQVKRMTAEVRKLPEGWRTLIENSKGWLLLIRPGTSRDFADVVSRPLHSLVDVRRESSRAAYAAAEETGGVPNLGVEWSDQALLVETLQILMEVMRVTPQDREGVPAIAVAMTCWDEVFPDDGIVQPRPPEVLTERYPLLASFIEANWSADRRLVFGLSAQGRPLDTEEPDLEYAVTGPEENGFVIHPDGRRDDDLTAPIAMLIERMMP